LSLVATPFLDFFGATRGDPGVRMLLLPGRLFLLFGVWINSSEEDGPKLSKSKLGEALAGELDLSSDLVRLSITSKPFCRAGLGRNRGNGGRLPS
jgi:hypothetical protein